MPAIKSDITTVTAFAPASCANVAVGFDILGFALAQPGDEVTLRRRDDNQLIITDINSEQPLPQAVDKNTATVALQALLNDLKLTTGFDVSINKGFAVSSGMGSSAASAVAAVVAANAFLDEPVSDQQLIQYAMQGELLASGAAHPDNVAPSLIGGLVLTYSLDPIAWLKLPLADYYWIVVHPDLQVNTKKARGILTDSISLTEHIQHSAKLAAAIAALYRNDTALLKSVLVDTIIEPLRAQLIPGFYQVKSAALEAGALAASISGSGPSIFALADSENDARKISQVMLDCFANLKITAQAWVSPSQTQGAVIRDIQTTVTGSV